MSMSSSPHSESPSHHIKEPTISLFNTEEIIKFALIFKKINLTDAQKNDITTAFHDYKSLSLLSDMLNNFVEMKNNLNSLCGLSDKQQTKLKALLEIRKNFKKTYRNKLSTSMFEKFIANEKKINPYNQAIQWWQLNTESLRKEKVWKDIKNLIVTQASQRGEAATAIKKKLSLLKTIKSNWTKSQLFAGFSSEKLLTFYKEYILIMKEALNTEKKSNKKYPAIIHEYIENLQAQIQAIQKQAVCSMLYRLQCAEYYHDIECDDLLSFTFDLIDDKGNINIQRIGLKPKHRRSLSPQIIANLVNIIEEYCRSSLKESDLLKEMDKLNMSSIPNSWKANDADAKKLVKNRTMAFFAFAITELLQDVSGQKNLGVLIINSNLLHDKSQALNKLHHLIELVTIEHANLTKKKPFELKNSVSKFIAENTKKYNSILNDLFIKINFEIENQLDHILDAILEKNEVDYDEINSVIKRITIAKHFNNHYLKNDFLASGDIILVLATRLVGEISSNQKINAKQCENLYKLITVFYPHIVSDQLRQLQETFKKLPESINKFKDIKGSQLLHYVINYLEFPFLTSDQINLPLTRHKHIAKSFDEKWEDHIQINQHETQNKIDLLISYLKNVSMKLLQFATCINLEDFDNTHGCRICAELKNYIQDGVISETQKTIISELRNEYELAVLNKINNNLQIKSYLYLANEKKMDLDKLRLLCGRINLFFTNAAYKKMMLQAVTNSCLALIKNDILNAVENEIVPDITYIKELNLILNDNLFLQLCNDNDIKKIMHSYISTYDGTKTHLSRLLTELIPSDRECEKLLITYAKKRLDFAKSSQDITSEDYYFFSHYLTIPDIATFFNITKQSIHSTLQPITTNPNIEWQTNYAKFIELFGDDNAIKQYRLKKILELLNVPSMKHAEQVFSEFMGTINKTRLFNNQIIEPNTIIINNISLEDYLNDLISRSAWSPLLELITSNIGTKTQQQKLHTNAANQLLLQKSKIIWPGPVFNQSKNDNTAKQFYLDYFGEENAKKICQLLDLQINNLAKIISSANTNEILHHELEALNKEIELIRPLQHFHKVMSEHKDAQLFCSNLDSIKSKLKLHYELFAIIKQHSILLDVTHDSSTLKNSIDTFAKTFNELIKNNLINETNIDYFTTFCHNNLFSKIEMIFSSNQNIDFETLFLLDILLTQLSTDKLRRWLLAAHKHQISSNPLWLGLTNHLDDREYVEKIARENIKNNTTTDFEHALAFAKSLSNIKFHIKNKLKQNILIEAQININNANFSDALSSTQTSDKHLMKLWAICYDKFNNKKPFSLTGTNQVLFLIKTLCKVSTEILHRSENNNGLLLKLIEQLQLLPDIKQAITSFSNANKPSHLLKHSNSIWASTLESDVILRPVMMIYDKANILRLMHITKRYIAGKLPHDKQKLLKQFCNDPVFPDAQTLKNKLGLKHDLDAHKLFYAHHIYQKLLLITQNTNKLNEFTTFLKEIQRESSLKSNLAKSKGYNAFLNELQILFTKNLMTMPKEYSLQENKKIQSSH